MAKTKQSKSKNRKKKVILLGDPTVDCFLLFNANREKSEKADMDWQKHSQWRSWMLPGGVHLSARFMTDIGLEVSKFGPNSIEAKEIVQIGSLARLQYVQHKKGRKQFSQKPPESIDARYRLSSLDGYQAVGNNVERGKHQGFSTLTGKRRPRRAFRIRENPKSARKPDILVINDAGAALRRRKKIFDRLRANEWISGMCVMLKMHQPLAKGHAWKMVRAANGGERIIFVSADDLRASGVAINHCLSWDAVLEDLSQAMESSDFFRSLMLPASHLVILFDAEAAICLSTGSNDGRGDLSLVLDPHLAEGDIAKKHDGELIGKMNCFLAHFVDGLPRATDKRDRHHDIVQTAKKALIGLRRFAEDTMTISKSEKGSAAELSLDYPVISEVEQKEFDNATYVDKRFDLDVVQSFAGGELPFSLLVHLVDDREKRAADVVRRGTVQLRQCPAARFGNLLTVDRVEIEGYRAIDRLLHQYLNNVKESKPISIAVFGPPGSGKSFGIKQLVDENRTPIKEFNLSQVQPSDLRGFFHEIRDHNLKGETPLCFFDEFDAQGKQLVAHFLAPMQDGKFRDGARVHPIGRGIFVFAGGTSHSFQRFAAGGADDRALKIPDFASRLRGYIDIRGINPVDEDGAEPESNGRGDRHFEHGNFEAATESSELRRAILLRAFLKSHLPGIIGPGSKDQDDGRADVEQGVIDAFLRIDRYRHGARSMEQIVRMCHRGAWMTRLSVSDLPEQDQLEMHVDGQQFLSIARGL